MTEAETVDLICDLLEAQEPFVHVRFGDGDVFFATGTGPVLTGDGEEWSPELAAQLRDAWADYIYPERLLLGDIRTYEVSDGCEEEWDLLLTGLRIGRNALQKPEMEMVHMEALRVGFGHAMSAYLMVKADQRSKLFVGPDYLAPIASMLGCDFCPVPLKVAYEHSERIAAVAISKQPDIMLFAAGRGGKIMQGKIGARARGITQIDVGSGLDLLSDAGVRRGTDIGVNREKILREYRRAGLCP